MAVVVVAGGAVTVDGGSAVVAIADGEGDAIVDGGVEAEGSTGEAVEEEEEAFGCEREGMTARTTIAINDATATPAMHASTRRV